MNLRDIRINEGLTITELAKKANVSTRTITRIESCEGKSKVETLNKILNTLNNLSGKRYSFENVFGSLAQ
jgi:predicted transcriptional regulator